MKVGIYMLSRDDFCLTLEAFAEMELVKSHIVLSPTQFSYQMYVNIKEKTHTQDVVVMLVDETHVMAYSRVGPCPNDAGALSGLLAENMDGCYTRLANFDCELVQLYRYPLEFLEVWELSKALDELSQLANFAQRKYFEGGS